MIKNELKPFLGMFLDKYSIVHIFATNPFSTHICKRLYSFFIFFNQKYLVICFRSRVESNNVTNKGILNLRAQMLKNGGFLDVLVNVFWIILNTWALNKVVYKVVFILWCFYPKYWLLEVFILINILRWINWCWTKYCHWISKPNGPNRYEFSLNFRLNLYL